MGRFDPKFDQQTKNAVAKACLDGLDGNGKRSRPADVKRALAEGLIPNIPAQEMSDSMVRICAEREQRRRDGFKSTPAARMQPQEAKEHLRKRVVTIIETVIAKSEDDLKRVTADDGIKLARLWRELDAMGTGQPPRHLKRKADPDSSPSTATQQASSTVTRLVLENERDVKGQTTTGKAA